MKPLLQLDAIAVEVASGVRLLELEALSVGPGETLAILGPTGAGKSTLLRVINGLLKPTRGQLWWQGRELGWPMPLETRRKMSMAFQDPLLFRGSVMDNVAYGLRVRGRSRAEIGERVRKALESFSIAHLAERPCTRLSGGEAHRVSLARAMVVEPELLLLDEPLASLDAVTRERLEVELRTVLRAQGTACVYVTHHQREAQRIADRVAVLDAGKVLQVGTPDEVFYAPASERVARFVQAGNLLPGVVRHSNAGSVSVEVNGAIIEAVSELEEGTAVTVCVRAEDIAIAPLTERAQPASNHLRCTVAGMQAQGPIVQLTLDGGIRLAAIVTRRRAQELGLAVGQQVQARFRAAAARVLLPRAGDRAQAASGQIARRPSMQRGA